MSDAATLLQKAVSAHGGMDRWNSLDALDVEISAAGFLFTAKRRPVLKHVRMRAWTREPRFALYDYPKPGQTAELIGTNEVRITGSDGKVFARRTDPRKAFSSLRHIVSWDDLDFIYFAGYATWNYLTEPFLLTWPGFVLKEVEPIRIKGKELRRLQATFPDTVPTHSREQAFYFDENNLLMRLDYTAEVVGGWAHAAHFCEEHSSFGGIVAPIKRHILPLPFGTRPLPGPTLVSIEVHNLNPVAAKGTA